MFASKPYKSPVRSNATARSKSSQPSSYLTTHHAASPNNNNRNNKNQKPAAVAATRRITAVPIATQLATAFKFRTAGYAPERIGHKAAAWDNISNKPERRSSSVGILNNNMNNAPSAVALLCLSGVDDPVGYEAPLAPENGSAQMIVAADHLTVSLENYLVSQAQLTGQKTVSLVNRNNYQFDCVVPVKDFTNKTDEGLHALSDQLCGGYLTKDLLPRRGGIDGNHLPTGHSCLLLQPAYNNDHKDIFSSPDNSFLMSLCRGFASHLLRADCPFFGGVGLSVLEIPPTSKPVVHDVLGGGTELPMTSSRKVPRVGSFTYIHGPSRPHVEEFTDFSQVQDLAAAIVNAAQKPLASAGSHRVFLLQLLLRDKKDPENNKLSHAVSPVSMAIVQLADFAAANNLGRYQDSTTDDNPVASEDYATKVFNHLARDRREILGFLGFAASLNRVTAAVGRESGILAPTSYHSTLANVLNFYCWYRPEKSRTALISLVPSKIDGNSLFEVAGVSAALGYTDNVKKHEIPKRTLNAIDMRDVAIQRWHNRAERFRNQEPTRRPWQTQFNDALKAAHESVNDPAQLNIEELIRDLSVRRSFNDSTNNNNNPNNKSPKASSSSKKENFDASTSEKEEVDEDEEDEQNASANEESEKKKDEQTEKSEKESDKYESDDDFEEEEDDVSQKKEKEEEESKTPAKKENTRRPSELTAKKKAVAPAPKPPAKSTNLASSTKQRPQFGRGVGTNSNKQQQHRKSLYPPPRKPATKQQAPSARKSIAAPTASSAARKNQPPAPTRKPSGKIGYSNPKARTSVQVVVAKKKKEEEETNNNQQQTRASSSSSTTISDVSSIDNSLINPPPRNPPPSLSQLEEGREHQDEELQAKKQKAPHSRKLKKVSVAALKSKKTEVLSSGKLPDDVGDSTAGEEAAEEEEEAENVPTPPAVNDQSGVLSVKSSRSSSAASNPPEAKEDNEEKEKEKEETDVEKNDNQKQETEIENKQDEHYSRGSSAARSEERRQAELEAAVNNSSRSSSPASRKSSVSQAPSASNRSKEKSISPPPPAAVAGTSRKSSYTTASSYDSRRSSSIDSRASKGSSNSSISYDSRRRRSSSVPSSKFDSRQDSAVVKAASKIEEDEEPAKKNDEEEEVDGYGDDFEEEVLDDNDVNKKTEQEQQEETFNHTSHSVASGNKKRPTPPSSRGSNLGSRLRMRKPASTLERLNEEADEHGVDGGDDENGKVPNTEQREEEEKNPSTQEHSHRSSADPQQQTQQQENNHATQYNFSSSSSTTNNNINNNNASSTSNNTVPASTIEAGEVAVISLPKISPDVDEEINSKRQAASTTTGIHLQQPQIIGSDDEDEDERPVIGGETLEHEILDSPDLQ